jgi:hypothetical protein
MLPYHHRRRRQLLSCGSLHSIYDKEKKEIVEGKKYDMFKPP